MIIVVKPDEGLLEEVRHLVENLGYACETSRGEEQAILSLSGNGKREELEEALSRLPDVDVIPILSGHEYWRLRSRRRFMNGLCSGLGVVTAVGAAIPILGFLLPPKKGLSTPDLVRAASVDQVPENSARLVRVQGKPVLLVHRANGNYFALSATCTHMDVCQLDWNPERQQLLCPCHGGAFDVYGNVVQGPPFIPLPTYEVDRVADQLFIRREG